MPELLLATLAIIGGFIGLVWSADRFVAGAASLANNFGISKLVIGLTIVSMGTSAPEILVSVNASLSDAGDLAIGNALGSNLANIGLVLAITALIAPLPIQRHLLTQETPILLGVTALAGIFLWDAHLARWEGLTLALMLIPLFYFLIKVKSAHPSEEEEDPEIPDMTKAMAIVWFIGGLALLVVSSDWLVWGAKSVATHFGVSPLIIGLTVVAVGTSLPELAASVMSALKGHSDIALGNIVGSNIFNLLAVMSLPGIINPLTLESAVFARDYLAMGGMTAFLCLALFVDYRLRRRNGATVGHLGRRIATLLLLSYFAYYVILLQGTM